MSRLNWSGAPGADTAALQQRRSNEQLPFVRRLFNETAPHYDHINQLFSLGSGGWYRRRCLTRAGLRPGHRVIDVAVGTGLVAEAAVAVTGSENVIGLDVSEAMLAVARKKLSIPLIQGAAEELPFGNESTDFVTMGYAIRHIPDLELAFREFRRVLRRNGTLVLLEISKPKKLHYRLLISGYFGRVIPHLCRWTTGDRHTRDLIQYHWETMENCVLPSDILDAMARSGFSDLRCEVWFDVFRSYVGCKM